MINHKITHKYTAKPWETPIDDPVYFTIEVLFYRKNKLLLFLKDTRSNKKYSLQVNERVHLRYVPDRFRFSIWTYPEWEKLVQNKFTCAVLENSNFQLNIIQLKDMPNYFLICNTDMLEILTNSKPIISSVNDKNMQKMIAEFLNIEEAEDLKIGFSNVPYRSKKDAKKNNASEFESLIKNAQLYFELLIFSQDGVFIVRDSISKQRYQIKIPIVSCFQCIQSPDHSKDYSMIDSIIKDLNRPVSPLWKLDTSGLREEEIDLGLLYDEKDFGSLYIKTDNVEIETVSYNPPQISLENRDLLDLVKDSLTQTQ